LNKKPRSENRGIIAGVGNFCRISVPFLRPGSAARGTYFVSKEGSLEQFLRGPCFETRPAGAPQHEVIIRGVHPNPHGEEARKAPSPTMRPGTMKAEQPRCSINGNGGPSRP